MKSTPRHLLSAMGVTLLLGLLHASSAQAQSGKKIITLGKAGDSAVLSSVTKTRTRLNAKEMLGTARARKEKLKTDAEERGETKKRLRAQLADVDAVVADLSAPGTSEDDGLMVEAALEEGVPVVLENADSTKMAALTGIGVEAKTAVIETRDEGGEFNITIVDGPEPTIQEGPVQSFEPPAQPTPDNPAMKEQLARYEAQQQAARAGAPKAALTQRIAKLTGAQKAAQVETLISQKAFKKGARRHGLITGQCSGGVKCREGSVTKAISFCPGDLCSAYSTMSPILEWGVYKTESHDPATGKVKTSAYVTVRAAGRPNLAMMWDATQNRGYFLESWNIQLAATYPAGKNWVLAKATPENANKQGSVAWSTGFTVGASTDKTVNVSYSQSETRTMNTEEFGITRSTTLNGATWTTKMQIDAQARAYSTPSDLFIYWFLSTTDVALLPTIAKQGTDFHAEAVWDGDRDASCGSCTVEVTGTFSVGMQRAWSVLTPAGRTAVWRPYTQAFGIATSPDTLKIATNW